MWIPGMDVAPFRWLLQISWRMVSCDVPRRRTDQPPGVHGRGRVARCECELPRSEGGEGLADLIWGDDDDDDDGDWIEHLLWVGNPQPAVVNDMDWPRQDGTEISQQGTGP